MNEQELLKQISSMFRENTEVLSQMMDEKISFAIDESERRTRVLIEQTVMKKIDSLFDGYVATRERQEIMQTQMDTLAARLETLELIVKNLQNQGKCPIDRGT